MTKVDIVLVLVIILQIIQTTKKRTYTEENEIKQSISNIGSRKL